MLSWLKRFLSKLWDFIRKVAVVVLLCLAVYILVVSGGVAFLGALGTGVWSALFWAGVAFVIDPELAGEIVQDGVEAVVEVVVDIVEAVAEGIGGGLADSGLFTYLLLGVGAYFLLTRSGSSDQRLVLAPGAPATAEGDLDNRPGGGV